MTKQKINCEQDAITWVALNLPVLTKPSRKCKQLAVYTFSSLNAFDHTADRLGKELWKLLKSK